MINNEAFAKRLEKVIEFYGESASSFAEKIGVQRSSISHILSGRNKPSLDFVLKVLSSFPEVELYWLLNGKGQFPNYGEAVPAPSENKNPEPTPEKKSITPDALGVIPKNNKAIKQIVIFYEDGTFENFEQN